MVRNKLHWDANDAVGLSKQRNSYQSSPTFLSVLKVPLRHLRPSVIYSVPCDRILQMAYWNPKGTGKRGHIVAHDVSWASQTPKHLLRTQNVSEQNQEHFCVPGTKLFCVRQQILRARANGETFVSATICRQQCVLVCQYLKAYRIFSPSKWLLHPLKRRLYPYSIPLPHSQQRCL